MALVDELWQYSLIDIFPIRTDRLTFIWKSIQNRITLISITAYGVHRLHLKRCKLNQIIISIKTGKYPIDEESTCLVPACRTSWTLELTAPTFAKTATI